MLSLVVLISGGGSNLRALLDASQDAEFPARVIAVGADRDADGFAYAEEYGIPTAAFHGNKSQNARQAALGSFAQGRIRVLVATDIAARGIDVPNITHVINFDLPVDAESYVHRVGRTARASAGGSAISLCAPDERGELRAIERVLRRALPTEDGNHLANGIAPEQPAAASRRPDGHGAPSMRDDERARPPRQGHRRRPNGRRAA